MTAADQRIDETSAPERARSRNAGAVVERFALLGAWALVIVVFGILRPDTFLTSANFSTIFGSQAVLVVLTLALLAYNTLVAMTFMGETRYRVPWDFLLVTLAALGALRLPFRNALYRSSVRSVQRVSSK